MNPDHSTGGVSRRTWRTAVVLFLVVFLGGLGLTGASALWSQQGTVQATVSTGSWCSTPEEKWELPMRIYAADFGWDGSAWVRTAWKPENGRSFDPCVTFKATLEPMKSEDGRVISRRTVDAGQDPQASYWVATGQDNTATFRLTVTPYMNNVAGKPESVNIIVRVWDRHRSTRQGFSTDASTDDAAQDETTPQVEVEVIDQ
ncbi:hypothetical protein ACFFIO_15775 [Citricoccus parietis]|uniref:Secreted protein n=1 Tax=Citricoccus parietis TaxID=592307 RepID=A0ABV6F8W0_9MICC